MDTFFMKLWQLFRSQLSLWAHFLLGKYCKGDISFSCIVPRLAFLARNRLKLVSNRRSHTLQGMSQIIFFQHNCQTTLHQNPYFTSGSTNLKGNRISLLALGEILDNSYWLFHLLWHVDQKKSFICSSTRLNCLERARWQLCYQVGMIISPFGSIASGLIPLTMEYHYIYYYFILLLKTMERSDSSGCYYINGDWKSFCFPL